MKTHHPENIIGPRYKTFHAVLAFLLFCLTFARPLYAAEPVTIIVTGIEGDVLKNVQEALVLPPGVVQDGVVDPLWLERYARQAETKAGSALEPFGYYNSVVTVAVEPAESRYKLLVAVTPGEQVRLSGVTVTLAGPGSGEKRLQRLIESFPLMKGDVLLHQRYEAAKAALASRAQELGYLDAAFSRHEIRINRSATTATIDLAMESGEKYFFGATRILGAPDYPDSFLRRYLTYLPGEPFSFTLLGETQRNLTNSERFKELIVSPERQNTEAYKVPITIQLKQGPRFSLRPGIGYGTDTGARFTVRYRDLNMFHLGHELYSHLYVAERLRAWRPAISSPVRKTFEALQPCN